MAGAFTGIRRKEKRKPIGFQLSEIEKRPISLEDIVKYGFPKEIIGRIGEVIELNPITEDILIDILKNSNNSTYNYYQYFFRHHGIHLNLSEKNLSIVAKMAMNQKIGARGIQYALSKFFKNKMYDLFYDI